MKLLWSFWPLILLSYVGAAVFGAAMIGSAYVITYLT